MGFYDSLRAEVAENGIAVGAAEVLWRWGLGRRRWGIFLFHVVVYPEIVVFWGDIPSAVDERGSRSIHWFLLKNFLVQPEQHASKVTTVCPGYIVRPAQWFHFVAYRNGLQTDLLWNLWEFQFQAFASHPMGMAPNLQGTNETQLSAERTMNTICGSSSHRQIYGSAEAKRSNPSQVFIKWPSFTKATEHGRHAARSEGVAVEDGVKGPMMGAVPRFRFCINVMMDWTVWPWGFSSHELHFLFVEKLERIL